MKTFWLSAHLDYRCRHSGACCSARWPIPVERDRASAIGAAVIAGRVAAQGDWLLPSPQAPREVAGVLALQPSGRCVFHQAPSGSSSAAGGGCAIYTVRPSSCEHFPFVCVTDPRGVHVTLSHFCPTAAALLFDAGTPLRVVEGPPIFPDGREAEGLDAREALPPVAGDDAGREEARRRRCGARLLSWEDVSAWEAAYARRLTTALEQPDTPSLEEFNHARASVPHPWTWPEAPDGVDTAWREIVAPEWQRWSAPIGRYLASKVHASWAMHLGSGPRDVERQVSVAHAVLQVEAVRRVAATGSPFTRAALTEAVRRSDLLLMHLADPGALCSATG